MLKVVLCCQSFYLKFILKLNTVNVIAEQYVSSFDLLSPCFTALCVHRHSQRGGLGSTPQREWKKIYTTVFIVQKGQIRESLMFSNRECECD